MAFGFTPKHEVEINLNGFDPKQYLAICLNTAEILKWRITYVSKSGFTAVIKKSLFSNSYEFKLVIINDLASIRCESLGSEMFDWGKNKAIVEQFTGTYENLQGIITDEEITNKLVEINGVFETEEEDALTAPPATAAENFKNFLSLFVPHPGYFVTPIIICINLAIFIAMVISGVHIIEPTGADLINWGANLRPVTLSGEWWRLISSNFLHIGVIHLLLNMYALLFIGILLEPHLGRVRYLSAYLITGVFASLVSIYWHDRTISAGASGAIFGLYGVFLAMLTTSFIEKSLRKELLSSIAVFVVFNLVYGLKGGIDNAAHIGGLISGLIIGYCYYPGLIKPLDSKIKYGTLAALLVISVVLSISALKTLPNEASPYEMTMQRFIGNEKAALAVLNDGGYQTQEKVISGLKTGIRNWKANIKLINDMENTELSDVVMKRNTLLKEYCQVRLKYYELMLHEQIEGSSDADVANMDSCNIAIGKIVTEINALGSTSN